MKSHLETTRVGNIMMTRISPLAPENVRFSLTAKINGGAKLFTQSTLSMYASLLLTKTKRRTKTGIEEYLKQYGIFFAITSGIESITFTGSVRREHVPRVASLLTELICEPVVSAHEFSQKQKLMIEANREAHDDAKRIAHVGFINTLYREEPRLILDTLATERAHIQKLKESDVVKVHKILPHANWYLTLVGDAHAEHGFLSFLKILELTATPFARKAIEARPAPRTAIYSPVHSKTNIEVQLGNIVTIGSDDPSFAALDFGINVLGKVGGFSGRLMSTVREKEGLTYGIYAHTNPHHLGDSFHFVIRTFFMAKDYEKGMASTMRELTDIVAHGITRTELSVFKEINRNEYILAHESNKSRLAFYHNLIVRGHTESSILESHAKIETLTQRDVNNALKKYIDPSRLVLSAAGPIEKSGAPISNPHTA